MGLTVFNNLVNIIQPLTKIYEFFRVRFVWYSLEPVYDV